VRGEGHPRLRLPEVLPLAGNDGEYPEKYETLTQCSCSGRHQGKADRPSPAAMVSMPQNIRSRRLPTSRVTDLKIAPNGGSACVLPDFSITQRDAACRRSPMPTVGAVWRDWFWRPSSGEVSVDAASASGRPPSARSRLIGAVGWGCWMQETGVLAAIARP
jgi:hypothetical protein